MLIGWEVSFEMEGKVLGRQSFALGRPPAVLGEGSVVGEKEGAGPLGNCFDLVSTDAWFGEKSWEKAESAMLRRAFHLACHKAGVSSSQIQLLFAGDLLNQCVSSAFAVRESAIPYFGLYGACSTMAESLALAAMCLDGGFGSTACAMTSSHFCSAERQFRFPLNYGGQRCPTAQWTVTGAGAVILRDQGPGPYVTHVTVGHVVDAGITDAGNMGAAMAPAAFESLSAHFSDTGRTPGDYDAILTGDLGLVGRDILTDLFRREGTELGPDYDDCGAMIFDGAAQDTHAGGSGCGCAASVLCGMVLPRMRAGKWNRVLFCATGALMSSTTSLQGESIPGICHAVCLDMDRGC